MRILTIVYKLVDSAPLFTLFVFVYIMSYIITPTHFLHIQVGVKLSTVYLALI